MNEQEGEFGKPSYIGDLLASGTTDRVERIVWSKILHLTIEPGQLLFQQSWRLWCIAHVSNAHKLGRG